MITEELIRRITNELLEGSNKFIINVKVSSGNLITVVIDGDEPLRIEDCVEVSRHIEGNLDREVEDFELRVFSAGIDQPYVQLRQYIKNRGREVEVSLKDGSSVKGILLSANEQYIQLEPKVAKRKKKATGIPAEGTLTIPFSEIKQTREIISFK
ncbi:MAG: ribosome assembly cofactor RimP [Bacteroidota bacterium]|nr:ribosome assembly cofactor RimP [Bacteroidota bacterium]